jgi:hypothetical protein
MNCDHEKTPENVADPLQRIRQWIAPMATPQGLQEPVADLDCFDRCMQFFSLAGSNKQRMALGGVRVCANEAPARPPPTLFPQQVPVQSNEGVVSHDRFYKIYIGCF